MSEGLNENSEENIQLLLNYSSRFVRISMERWWCLKLRKSFGF